MSVIVTVSFDSTAKKPSLLIFLLDMDNWTLVLDIEISSFVEDEHLQAGTPQKWRIIGCSCLQSFQSLPCILKEVICWMKDSLHSWDSAAVVRFLPLPRWRMFIGLKCGRNLYCFVCNASISVAVQDTIFWLAHRLRFHLQMTSA